MIVFVKQFKHWRSGKILHAKDYGLEAFPLKIYRKCRICHKTHCSCSIDQ